MIPSSDDRDGVSKARWRMACAKCSAEGQCERLVLWPRGATQKRQDLPLSYFGTLPPKHVCGCELAAAETTKAYRAITSSLAADFSRSGMDLFPGPKPIVRHEINKDRGDTLQPPFHRSRKCCEEASTLGGGLLSRHCWG